MKINAAAFALLATAAAAPMAAVDKTITAVPKPEVTKDPVEACVMPNDCAGNPDDKGFPEAPETATTTLPVEPTFEPCMMPNDCAGDLDEKAVSEGLAPLATTPPLHVPLPVVTIVTPLPKPTSIEG